MPESYTPRETLQALYETLELARSDLNWLLRADHPPCEWPCNIWQRIAKERQTVQDLEALVHDEMCKIALDEMRQLAFA